MLAARHAADQMALDPPPIRTVEIAAREKR